MIGILGGLGPAAGVKLADELVKLSDGASDQRRPEFTLLSLSGVPDRTAFLFDPRKENPAWKLIGGLRRLERLGASVAAIACNTAHAKPIFDLIQKDLADTPGGLHLLHLINEVTDTLAATGGVRRVALFATLGCWKAGIYHEAFQNRGMEVLRLSDQSQMDVHQCIYDCHCGLKCSARPDNEYICSRLERACEEAVKQGAEAVVLGCTELSFVQEVVQSHLPPSTLLVDSTQVLAKALYRSYQARQWAPESLQCA